jgi:hypothetical protein
VEASGAQLERWRTAGVLPRNQRRGLGRGAGSVSDLPDEAVTIAEALAFATQRGRSLHEAVLRVFTFNPKFRLKIFLVTPPVPLPEQAVREALAWFIRYRDNSLSRRIERAAAAAPSADDAEDTADKLARSHYLGVYRAGMRDLTGNIVTRGPQMTRGQAHAYADIAMVSAVGLEAVGPDLYAEAIRDSFGNAGEYQATIDYLIQAMKAENTRRELAGQPPLSGPRSSTIESDIEAIRLADFTAIRQVRDVLSLLAEAATIYEATRERLPHGPATRRLLDFFASSNYANFLVRLSSLIARSPVDESWNMMAAGIVMVCSDPEQLSNFEEVARSIDFTSDDIRRIITKSRGTRMTHL